MSATRLLVLGAVRMRGEAHGYQVRQDLLLWAADQWANVKPGSIYHALKKLAADGLLEEVSTEESELGPDRVVYRITPQGEGEFFFLLNKGIAETETGPAMFNAALPFITTLERGNLIFLLKSRIQQTKAGADSTRLLIDNTIAPIEGQLGKPPHVREMFTYWLVTIEAELNWLQDLVTRIEAGEYTFTGESPDAFGNPPR
ncbi:PadR family transcriptional regulator [Kibdelosporangium aridum]|uniref:Transcriptional regulator PadR-like family protein n=1 Tax=Kibdelosporangium aridum TaxID=2030 RepID=A0A1Y5XSB3_KIBAR|nr:PadR family transcriptional regulator [Kibdelosporangium aridum]SMD14869.1 Transcriptional regulator PadR-like family protein [Kibdelosporangium aridum]